jgi:arabinogalactan oligomer/maltooligosaccharide transport system substrate-binding protein
MFKLRTTLFSIMVIAGLLLAACGGGGGAAPTQAPVATQPPAAQPTQPPAAQPTEATGGTDKPVKLTVWHQWTGEYLNTITEAFNDYTKMHPNVTFDLSKPEAVNDALKVAIPAGEGPDIIGWANDNIGAQALVGNILPLNDYGIDEAFLNSTYEPAAVKGVVWQGKIWGLPESQEGIAFVYNKELVTDEYLPTDPLDFDDLLAKAQAFAEANPGKFLLCNQGLGGKDAYHAAPIYFGHGVPTYVDDEGKVYLNTPEAIAAATWLTEFKEVAPQETSHDICKAMITEGNAGAWWTGPWAIADLEAAGIDYGILPLGRPFVGIKTLMLSKNAKDRGNDQVAVDVMKYFTSAEVQKKLALANKTIPAPTAAVKDAEVAALPTLAGFGAALNLGVPMANTPFASAQWDAVGDATQAIWTGTQQPEEAMAAAQKTAEDKIKEMQ